jgi:hypothetical protein
VREGSITTTPYPTSKKKSKGKKENEKRVKTEKRIKTFFFN